MRNKALIAAGLPLILSSFLACGGATPAGPSAVPSAVPSPVATPTPAPALIAGSIAAHVRGNDNGDNANPFHVNQRVDLLYSWICRADDGTPQECTEQPITVGWSVPPPCHFEGDQGLRGNTLKCDEPTLAVVNANAVTTDGRTINASFNAVVIQ